MTRSESRRAKSNGIPPPSLGSVTIPSNKVPLPIDPTLANPPKAALPSPQNPTVPAPSEVVLTEEEHQHFVSIRRTLEALNQQAQTVTQQANGALVMVLIQRKINPGADWELSDDARKVIRKQSPQPVAAPDLKG